MIATALCKFHSKIYLTLLPNDKILDPSKLKGFTNDKKKCDSKIEICLGKGRKHCGKRGKCWLPEMFSKGFFFKVVKSRDCMVKS